MLIAERFRGFLPVVVDVETGGFNSQTDALLEMAAITIEMDDSGQLVPSDRFFFNIEPFKGANIERAALEFTGIDPTNPLRLAVPEKEAISKIFAGIRANIKNSGCSRAIMVAHNAAFDLSFLSAAVERSGMKRNPFHPFSTFDTATLGALAFGQTVLSRACPLAGIEFDSVEAHSALYDCAKTADLFCWIVNRWQQLGGWPINSAMGQ
ncbi:MAG: ribonuclease T [Pseudomonadales bacterium]|jgi:ribonuclease T|nr:ribonuclease T [Pseudomonadales bacterium]MDP7359734.1 ribonuclease T [Pseudomonadales bacterium]MDP7598050.1 ribonuclease T [Pseudomonadales bacterium]HJN49110.1 ribonuclease T [Pseudomonadales bacterium]|tara:strand:- start:2002 stop:2628 length:627 start_codon:yes stop_codon:yes gene_type:complete